MLRNLFHPSYGEALQVSPKRWWSRKDRRSARLAAALIDTETEAICKEAGLRFRDEMFYGTRYVDASGKRIDPSAILPSPHYSVNGERLKGFDVTQRLR